MENNTPDTPSAYDDITGRIQPINLERERNIAINFKDAIIDMAVKARDKGETIILGLDTTWIPGGSGSSALLAEINYPAEGLITL